MTKNTFKTIQFFILFLIGVALVFLSFNKLNIHDILITIKTGNYWVAFPVYLVSISGYYFRILRWKLFYISMDEKPRKSMLFISLCVGYLVSFAVPRLGEITRCLMLKKSDNIPFNKSLITIVVERTIDTITLLILLVIAFVFNSSNIAVFIKQNILYPIQQRISFSTLLWIILSGIFLLFVLGWIIKYKLKNRKIYRFYLEFIHSIKSMLMMKHRVKFLLLTCAIWVCYFLMTYLWLFTFFESENLGMNAAFFVLVIGSIGRSIPIQGGGMGAYHFLVSQAFVLLGVSLLTGNALAIIIHGAQAVFTFFTGTICFIWFLLQFKKYKFET